jgi:urea transporter
VRIVVEAFRGVGQVDLQGRFLTGVIMTAALFSAGWEIGVFGLLGSAVATGTAKLLGVQRERIFMGLEGYCGTLTGIACVVIFGLHLSTWIVAIAGAVGCTVITAALGGTVGRWGLPALTVPFCIVGSALALGAPGFERIYHAGGGTSLPALPSVTSGPTELSLTDLFHSFFNNVAEIFLIDYWWSGAIMLVALLVAGWKVMLAAAGGSVIGTLTAWAIGAPADLIQEGIYGYNAVLVAIALGGALLPITPRNAVYAALACAVSVGLTAALANFFAPFGGHTFTWPFNLTTWAFLAAVPAFSAIKPAEPATG